MTGTAGRSRRGDVLDVRALNRATLARQLLLARQPMNTLDAVEHLVGLQAQAPFPPYYGLWSRLDGFHPESLADLLLERSVVRVALMRGTVHLVSARDCVALRTLVQPVFDRDLRSNTTHAPGLARVDLSELAAAGAEAVVERPLANKELGAVLARRWPDNPPTSLAYGVRNLLPMVQVPPRAVWGRSGQPICTTAQVWLGDQVGRPLTLDELVLRYLGAFGPASVQDVQTWCGLTGLREVVERLRPQLREFADENGRTLFDLPDAPRPDQATAAPVRFLPEFDNLLLSHADRTRVLTDEYRKRVFFSANGVFPGTFLVDGFVRGTWRLERSPETAVVRVSAYHPLSKRHQATVGNEAARLLRFAAAGADHDVRIVAAD